MSVQLCIFCYSAELIWWARSWKEQLPAPWVQHSSIPVRGRKWLSQRHWNCRNSSPDLCTLCNGHRSHTEPHTQIHTQTRSCFTLFKFNKRSWLQCFLLLGHKPWFCSRAAGTSLLNQSIPKAALQSCFRLFNGNKGNDFLHSTQVCVDSGDQWLDSEVFSSLSDCVSLWNPTVKENTTADMHQQFCRAQNIHTSAWLIYLDKNQ